MYIYILVINSHAVDSKSWCHNLHHYLLFLFFIPNTSLHFYFFTLKAKNNLKKVMHTQTVTEIHIAPK